MRIYTIGHSTHSLDKLIELLRGCGIRVLADIRRFPASRRHPWFSRDSLERELPAAGIEYRWFEPLGGHRRRIVENSPNTGLRVEAFRNYADHTATAEFRAAAEQLMHAALDQPAAYMCAEALYWQCHRMILSDYFTVHGWEVMHIFPSSETRAHRLTAGACLNNGQLRYFPAQLEF